MTPHAASDFLIVESEDISCVVETLKSAIESDPSNADEMHAAIHLLSRGIDLDCLLLKAGYHSELIKKDFYCWENFRAKIHLLCRTWWKKEVSE